MEKQTTKQASSKQPYEAPQATFVPLKLEEKLLGCLKSSYTQCDGTMGS